MPKSHTAQPVAEVLTVQDFYTRPNTVNYDAGESHGFNDVGTTVMLQPLFDPAGNARKAGSTERWIVRVMSLTFDEASNVVKVTIRDASDPTDQGTYPAASFLVYNRKPADWREKRDNRRDARREAKGKGKAEPKARPTLGRVASDAAPVASDATLSEARAYLDTLRAQVAQKRADRKASAQASA